MVQRVLTENSWCTRGNAGWRSRCRVCTTYIRVMLNPKFKGWTNQKPTCLKDNPERDLVPMRCCAYPGLPAKSCLQESTAFQRAKPNTFQKNTITWLFHFQEILITENLLLRKVLAWTICELKGKNTFPNLREGDSGQHHHQRHKHHLTTVVVNIINILMTNSSSVNIIIRLVH